MSQKNKIPHIRVKELSAQLTACSVRYGAAVQRDGTTITSRVFGAAAEDMLTDFAIGRALLVRQAIDIYNALPSAKVALVTTINASDAELKTYLALSERLFRYGRIGKIDLLVPPSPSAVANIALIYVALKIEQEQNIR